MKHLTQDELKLLLQEIPDKRQKLMFKVGFFHALRISEIVNLTKENIREGFVTIQRLKGSAKTMQPYIKHPDPELDESVELGELSNTLQKGEKLFQITRNGAYKLMQRAGKRAGIPSYKLHPHSLKHGCAMHLIQKKIGIEELRIFLGHKSLSSTGEYIKVSDEV